MVYHKGLKTKENNFTHYLIAKIQVKELKHSNKKEKHNSNEIYFINYFNFFIYSFIFNSSKFMSYDIIVNNISTRADDKKIIRYF